MEENAKIPKEEVKGSDPKVKTKQQPNKTPKHVELRLGKIDNKDVVFIIIQEGIETKRTWFERQGESEFLIITVEGFLEKGFTVSFT